MFCYGNLQTNIRPSPEVSIQVCNPLNDSLKSNVSAIVDTGAFMTCLPQSIIQQLGKLPYSQIGVQGPIGKPVNRKTYHVHIKIAEHVDQVVEVLAIPREYALIGRDILNRHKVVLDGPDQKWGFNGRLLDELLDEPCE